MGKSTLKNLMGKLGWVNVGNRVVVTREIKVKGKQSCLHICDEIGYVVGINASSLRLCNRGPVELGSEGGFEQYRTELKEDFGNEGYYEWTIPITEVRECQRARKY